MRNEILLSDDEIEARFDDLGYGVTVDDLALTRDTLADFRAARLSWADPGQVETDEDGVFIVRGAQAAKGQRRGDLVVIDFGAVRAAYR